MRYILFIVLLVFSDVALSNEPLNVGVVEGAPFVIKDKDDLLGISIRLWEEIADDLQVPFKYVEDPTREVDAWFDLLKKGEIDVLIGPISINKNRYAKADFTFPYFVNSIGVAIYYDELTNALLILEYFFISIGSLLTLVIVFFIFYVHLVWIYEKSVYQDMPKKYLDGMSYLFWNFLVLGHHRNYPATTPSKFILLLNLFTLAPASYVLKGAFISFFTVTLIQFIESDVKTSSLSSMRVGVIQGTQAQQIAYDNGLRIVSYPTFAKAMQALEEGKIQAYADDTVLLQYYLKEGKYTHFKITGVDLKHDLYAFGVTHNCPYLRDINNKILELRLVNYLQRICTTYLGTNGEGCDL